MSGSNDFRGGPNSTKGIPYSGFIDTIDIEGVGRAITDEASLVEVYLSETLLSPTLQTTVTVQDTVAINKNLDSYKSQFLNLSLYNPNIDFTLRVKQPIYRIENRKLINYHTEGYQLQACDDTLLNNAKKRMSSFYKCTNPKAVVSEALNCIDAKKIDFGQMPPVNVRNYQPNNIHPFQVVSEQADYSITPDGDPSYLHWMTYRDLGTHNFKSLRELTMNPTVWTYQYNDKGFDEQIKDPHNIMQYEFPCEFDVLSDIMNGLGAGKGFEPSITAMNMFSSGSHVVNNTIGNYCCGGIGGVMHASTFTNNGSHEDDGCETNVEQYLHIRPSRMALLQRDKISLKIIVPFNPTLHAGDMIEVNFIAKRDGSKDYGSGDYLIVNLSHNIKTGGYGISTFECVSRTVGYGEV